MTKVIKFNLSDYKDKIKDYDTRDYHVSVNGKSGKVTMKKLKNK